MEEIEQPSITVLLYQRFGDVLVPINEVRRAYFANRSPNRFRRALREGEIPLPITRLDASTKGGDFISIHQLAAYIAHCGIKAAGNLVAVNDDRRQLGQVMAEALIDPIPIGADAAESRANAHHHHSKTEADHG
ncbi:hypothetical protein R84981_000951 [Carnimonas sp. R-84981]|uniref:pyocin activator PrtN family protein n=1 Tax=Carnimonas bestiolae TaxID=3402172 RepID=UPI003EDBF7F0